MSSTITVDSSVPRRLLRAADTDLAEFFAFFTDNTRFQIGNSKIMVGKREIVDYVTRDLSSSPRFTHEILDEIYRDDTAALRVAVTYILSENSRVTVPGVIWMRLAKSKLAEYYVYRDLSPATSATRPHLGHLSNTGSSDEQS